MLKRYSYILLLTILAATLKFAGQTRGEADLESLVPLAPIRASASPVSTASDRDRLELLEILDQVVDRENYYRSIFGHYAPALTEMNLTLPPSLKEKYEIRIALASESRLRIEARSAEGSLEGIGSDQASVDQFYQLRANFPIPLPRPEYLRARAERHLRELAGLPRGIVQNEAGIFRGFFQFHGSFALGIKPPVIGIRCSLSDHGAGENDGSAQSSEFAKIGSDLEKIARSDLMEEGEDPGRRVAEAPEDGASNFEHPPQHELVIEKISP